MLASYLSRCLAGWCQHTTQHTINTSSCATCYCRHASCIKHAAAAAATAAALLLPLLLMCCV